MMASHPIFYWLPATLFIPVEPSKRTGVPLMALPGSIPSGGVATCLTQNGARSPSAHPWHPLERDGHVLLASTSARNGDLPIDAGFTVRSCVTVKEHPLKKQPSSNAPAPHSWIAETAEQVRAKIHRRLQEAADALIAKSKEFREHARLIRAYAKQFKAKPATE